MKNKNLKVIKKSKTKYGNQIKLVLNIDEHNPLYGTFAIYLKRDKYWEYIFSSTNYKRVSIIFKKLENKGYV